MAKNNNSKQQNIKKSTAFVPHPTHIGLIGHTYDLLKKYKLYKSRLEFFSDTLSFVGRDIYLDKSLLEKIFSNDIKHDYYSRDYKPLYESLLLDHKPDICESIKRRLNSKYSHINKQELLLSIINLLDTKEIYYASTPKPNKKGASPRQFCAYNSGSLQQLREYLVLLGENADLGYVFYLLLHISVTKELPSSFYMGINGSSDLEEFNRNALLKYGSVSDISILQITKMANEGNTIAKYYLAELYFYGNGLPFKQDLNKAFNLYQEAAGFIANSTNVNPLALWSLAFIYYYYNSDAKLLHNGRLPNQTIELIENDSSLSKNNRIIKAYNYAKTAASIAGPKQCPAALNLLGHISRNYANMFPDIRPAEEYYTIAAENEYVYAYNSLSEISVEAVLKSSTYSERLHHYRSVIDNLKKASAYNELWAVNRLARLLYTGNLSKVCNLKPEYGEIVFINEINPQEAKQYFMLAANLQFDKNSAWACLNLLNLFYDELSEDEILSYKNFIIQYDDKEITDQLYKLNI